MHWSTVWYQSYHDVLFNHAKVKYLVLILQNWRSVNWVKILEIGICCAKVKQQYLHRCLFNLGRTGNGVASTTVVERHRFRAHSVLQILMGVCRNWILRIFFPICIILFIGMDYQIPKDCALTSLFHRILSMKWDIFEKSLRNEVHVTSQSF